MEQDNFIKTENGLWLPTQYLEQVAPEEPEIEITFTAEGPLGLILLPDSSPVLLAQVAPQTQQAFPLLAPGIVLLSIDGRSIEGQRCADVVQQLKNSERPLTLTFQKFTAVAGKQVWYPGQNLEMAAGAVAAVGGHVTSRIGGVFGRIGGGITGLAGSVLGAPVAAAAALPSEQQLSSGSAAAADHTPHFREWEISIAVPAVISNTYYQMAVLVGGQRWSVQKRWSQFLELDAHLRVRNLHLILTALIILT